MSKVTEQKGAASSTPSPFKRWLISKVMNHLSSEERLEKVRRKREKKRQQEGRKHVLEYFHQADDGYSHLAIQLLTKLKDRYDIELKVHLVPALRDDNFPEPELWQQMSKTDANNVAPFYHLTFPDADTLPQPGLVRTAYGIFCRLNAEQFADIGVQVSESLWRNDNKALLSLAEKYGCAAEQEVAAKLEAGQARRHELKHYSSATFWYEGEWYWGADRIYHLEHRLQELGAVKANSNDKDTATSANALVAPRPDILSDFSSTASDVNPKEITLEFFASLRSPYTAVIWDATHKLVQDSGINLVVRPVLPMVMRGVPATTEKGFYLAMDVAREARTVNADYGHFYDPIGKPVLKGYSLYMWAKTKGKGDVLLAAFLKAAFARGINTTKMKGIQKVVEMAGLDWSEAKHQVNSDGWQDLLEENRLSMYEFGSWGVPSYRLLDASGQQVLGVWGQDRLWFVAQKIKDLLENQSRSKAP